MCQDAERTSFQYAQVMGYLARVQSRPARRDYVMTVPRAKLNLRYECLFQLYLERECTKNTHLYLERHFLDSSKTEERVWLALLTAAFAEATVRTQSHLLENQNSCTPRADSR
jgi:hypothetical protein